MSQQQETFSSLMSSFGYKYDLKVVFEDFMTMAMCAVTPIPGAGKSHYEDLYMQTIEKYKHDDLRHQFPKMFAKLVTEMEDRVTSSMGNDVLGEFYEQNFSRKNSGQYFTPYPTCQFMAQITCGEAKKDGKMQRAIDPTCGSGRMLVASSRVLGPENEYYGIDLDHSCVKMTAINLFLNGLFNSEVMCADALLPGDFRISYKISFMPLGIFRTEEKEQSKLWQMYTNSFSQRNEEKKNDNPEFRTDENYQSNNFIQLNLF